MFLKARIVEAVLVLAAAGLLSVGKSGALAQGPPSLVWQRGGHQGAVGTVAYSPRGDVFASASDELLVGEHDRTIKIWRAVDGILLRTILSPTGLSQIEFCADGQILAAAHQRGSAVDLWDLKTGRLIQTIQPGGRRVIACSSLLAVLVNSVGVRLYDLDGQEHQPPLSGGSGSGLAFSPDGSLLGSTSSEPGRIAMWRRNPEGIYEETEPLVGPTSSGSPVAFSPKGDLLGSSLGRDLTVWTLSSGTYSTIPTSHVVASVEFPRNSAVVASRGGTESRAVQLWKLKDGSLFQSLEGNSNWVMAMAFSPDGGRLVHSVYPREIKMWERRDDGSYGSRPDASGHTDTVFSVAFSPDGRSFASGAAIYNFGDGLGEIKLWDAANGDLLQTLPGHNRGVYGVGFSADGGALASAAWDRTVKVWARPSVDEPFQLLQTLTDHTDQVNSAVFFGNNLLASASKDTTVRLWRRSSGGVFALFQTLDRKVGGHEGEVERLAFSRNGRLLVSGGHDDKVKVWALRSDGRFQLFQTLDHTEEVETVALTSDARLIAAGGEEGTIRLWQIRPDGTYGVRDTFSAHSDEVHSIAFSPNDQFFVSVGDRTIRFWSSEDSGELLRYDEETGTGLEAVAFSPDGQFFGHGRKDATLSVAKNPLTLPGPGAGLR